MSVSAYENERQKDRDRLRDNGGANKVMVIFVQNGIGDLVQILDDAVWISFRANSLGAVKYADCTFAEG